MVDQHVTSVTCCTAVLTHYASMFASRHVLDIEMTRVRRASDVCVTELLYTSSMFITHPYTSLHILNILHTSSHILSILFVYLQHTLHTLHTFSTE